MSALDSILWDLEDYAGRAVDVVKVAAQIGVMVTKAYPFVVGGLLIVLSGIGFWLEDSSAPALTIPQQIVAHAKPGGTVYWTLQETGSNSTGLFSLGTDNKKQEADYLAALRFCIAHKGVNGCQQVEKAASYGI